ncbi:MAG: hypothetical protein IJ121_07755, partial [Eubacterium sp.]|nr:hypothetical protein [Eubacterium sp.]
MLLFPPSLAPVFSYYLIILIPKREDCQLAVVHTAQRACCFRLSVISACPVTLSQLALSSIPALP